MNYVEIPISHTSSVYLMTPGSPSFLQVEGKARMPNHCTADLKPIIRLTHVQTHENDIAHFTPFHKSLGEIPVKIKTAQIVFSFSSLPEI